jgi:hypothetical protein
VLDGEVQIEPLYTAFGDIYNGKKVYAFVINAYHYFSILVIYPKINRKE